MIRIAAVGDVHLGEDAQGRLRPALEHVSERADVLLLAGDLTRHGTPAEARIVAHEFHDLGLPVYAVLGNHDYHSDAVDEVTEILFGESGIRVLEGNGAVCVRIRQNDSTARRASGSRTPQPMSSSVSSVGDLS